MAAVDELITENLDVWTSAVKRKASSGRGGGKKLELYGIKKLRELILDLAVRGLLVPQDPEDEPASVLLKRIAEERAALLDSGTIKKQKPLPEIIGDEIPHSLPNSWAVEYFGKLAIIERGGSPRPIKSFITNDPDGLNWIKIGDTDIGGKYINATDEKIVREGLKKTRMVYPGDFLLTNSMSFGRPYITNIEGCIHDGWLRISPSNHIDKDYLYLLLSSPYIVTAFRASAAGAVVQNLNSDKVRETLILLPPIPEQHRIVAKVDELMALCDQLEQQTESSITAHQTLVKTLLDALTQAAATKPTIPEGDTNAPTPFTQAWNRLAEHFDTVFTTEDSIEQLKQTILQLAVMGKLVPQDPNDEPASVLLECIAAEKTELVKAKKIKKQKALPEIGEEEKPFELPEGWEWCRLPDIGELARGKSKHRPRNAPILFTDGTIPLVQTGDVSQSNGNITTYTALYNDVGVAQSRLWKKGTMCITIAANIADTGVLSFDACFPDSVVGFIPFDDEIQVEYFDYFIRTAKNELEKYAPSTAQKNINLEILGNLLVPLPPLRELKKIVAKVAQIMSICENYKRYLKSAKKTQLTLADTFTERVCS